MSGVSGAGGVAGVSGAGGAAIYLDNQSTTPLDPRALEAMMPFLGGQFGNPHSKDHIYGWRARDAVEQAREQVAALVNADAREIVFTSGATESCNQAILSTAAGGVDGRERVVTVATEHRAVLEPCDVLCRRGLERVAMPVGPDGLLDVGLVADTVSERTMMVSVMLANNEIGVVQPLAEISRICRDRGVLLHTDATQAVGKIPVDVDELGVDLMSFSAHKYYGPKGIGALYARWDTCRGLEPLLVGGDQERGRRAGTVAPFLAVGFGEASELAEDELDGDRAHTKALADKLYQGLLGLDAGIRLIGSPTERLPGNLSLSFPGVSGLDLVTKLGKTIAISTGSACNSDSAEVSHVLKALKLDKQVAYNTARFSIGRFNREEEIQQTIEAIGAVLRA